MTRPVPHRVALLLGHATFVALLVLACKHADLRMISGDSGFQFFKWVNDPGVSVEAHRYSAILPQLVVKAMKAFHPGLEALMYAASMAHVLVAYAVFLICLYVFKARRTALAAALAAVLCTRLTFYGPVLEANYLLAYPFLFFAAFEKGPGSITNMREGLGLLLLALPTVLVHPVGWGVLAFGVFFLMAVGRIRARDVVWMAVGLVLCFALVRMVFPPTGYERGQYAQLQQVLEPAGTWASWDFLVGHTFRHTNNYLPAMLALAAVLVTYGIRRKWLAALVVAGGVAGFVSVMLVAYRGGDDAIMMDRAFLPAAALIALPAAYLVYEMHGRGQWVAVLALAVILFVKLRDISFASRGPAGQLAQMELLLEEMRAEGVAKARVDAHVLKGRDIRATWALPFTSLLVSSMEGPGRSRIIVARGPDLGDGQGSPIAVDGFLLNARYFGPGTGPYADFPASTEPPLPNAARD